MLRNESCAKQIHYKQLWKDKIKFTVYSTTLISLMDYLHTIITGEAVR